MEVGGKMETAGDKGTQWEGCLNNGYGVDGGGYRNRVIWTRG